MNVLAITLFFVAWLFGAFGLFWIATAIATPRWFARNLSFSCLYRTRGNLGGEKWWSYPAGILIVIAVGRVVYCASYAVTFVIPSNWGMPSDDGDWTATRFYIQTSLAFFGSLLLVDSLEKNVIAIVRSKNELD